MIILPKK